MKKDRVAGDTDMPIYLLLFGNICPRSMKSLQSTSISGKLRADGRAAGAVSEQLPG